ncbi:hypothetical protein BJ165DRAFT_854043 [Panaeolus papilionaceus]|nr:hypothetical protein BJ165DRAFT_854043 [Panaeolus papilionaceus]
MQCLSVVIRCPQVLLSVSPQLSLQATTPSLSLPLIRDRLSLATHNCLLLNFKYILTMLGGPLTAEPGSYPSWPDMKYPAKKVERIRSIDASSQAFSSFPSRLSAASHSSSSFSGCSESDAWVPSLKTRQFSQTRNKVDDALISSYLSASGDSLSADVFCPPIMATSPLSQHNDDKFSPLQQCIASFAKQDKEYNPPFKIPASSTVDTEPEDWISSNNRRPLRNRAIARSPLVSSQLASSPPEEEMSTPFASNPSSCSSAASILSSVSSNPAIYFHPNKRIQKGYTLTESEIDQVLDLSAQQDGLELEEGDDDILTPASIRAKGDASKNAPDSTPKARAVKFTSSSTRYSNYGNVPGMVFIDELDQLIDNLASARMSAGSDAFAIESDQPSWISSFDDFDTIMASRAVKGRGRSSTSASAPPSLPTVVESDERTSPHSCDDFASSVTSLENNVSTCSSRCSTHNISPFSTDDGSVHPSPLKRARKFGRGRSLSESLTETIKKKGEGAAKTARHQWFYVTLHMRLRAFQAKKLINKASFKQLFTRSSRGDLKQGAHR